MKNQAEALLVLIVELLRQGVQELLLAVERSLVVIDEVEKLRLLRIIMVASLRDNLHLCLEHIVAIDNRVRVV